jgi:ketosteroid isomerase-like protein
MGQSTRNATTARARVARQEGGQAMAVDTNAATVDRIRALFERGSLEELAGGIYELSADDVIQEWPQSGERIRGRDNAKAINDNYPEMTGSTPKLSLRRVSGEGAHWVVEGTIDYGDGTPVSYVGVTELRDGRIAAVTEYFGNPFEAPAWRAQWVERIT